MVNRCGVGRKNFHISRRKWIICSLRNQQQLKFMTKCTWPLSSKVFSRLVIAFRWNLIPYDPLGSLCLLHHLSFTNSLRLATNYKGRKRLVNFFSLKSKRILWTLLKYAILNIHEKCLINKRLPLSFVDFKSVVLLLLINSERVHMSCNAVGLWYYKFVVLGKCENKCQRFLIWTEFLNPCPFTLTVYGSICVLVACHTVSSC